MVFQDLLGTLFSKFQIGIGGPQIKNNAGVIEVRNAADSAYVALSALLHKTYGDDFELNSGATSSGSSWKFTVRRPSTGMTHDLTLVYPSGDPTPGQALTVATFAGNVITLQWTTIAAGTDKVVTDTTSLAFGTASPAAMFTLPANAAVEKVRVLIDTAFNGTPTASVGIAGTTSKYMASTQVDLTAAATTVFEVTPGLASVGTTEALIITYAAGGASAGAARVEIQGFAERRGCHGSGQRKRGDSDYRQRTLCVAANWWTAGRSQLSVALQRPAHVRLRWAAGDVQ